MEPFVLRYFCENPSNVVQVCVVCNLVVSVMSGDLWREITERIFLPSIPQGFHWGSKGGDYITVRY